MAGYLRDARSGRSGWSIPVNIDWHVVVANPVRPWRRCSALCKVVAYPGCDGVFFHAAAGVSNRLRVFGGMSCGPSPFLFVFLHTSTASVSPRAWTVVPLKDNAVQSGCFALCAFALALGGVSLWVGGNRRRAAAMIILALVFLADIFMIFISKTGVLMTAALIGLFVVQLRVETVAVDRSANRTCRRDCAWSSVPAQRRLAENCDRYTCRRR